MQASRSWYETAKNVRRSTKHLERIIATRREELRKELEDRTHSSEDRADIVGRLREVTLWERYLLKTSLTNLEVEARKDR